MSASWLARAYLLIKRELGFIRSGDELLVPANFLSAPRDEGLLIGPSAVEVMECLGDK